MNVILRRREGRIGGKGNKRKWGKSEEGMSKGIVRSRVNINIRKASVICNTKEYLKSGRK